MMDFEDEAAAIKLQKKENGEVLNSNVLRKVLKQACTLLRSNILVVMYNIALVHSATCKGLYNDTLERSSISMNC